MTQCRILFVLKHRECNWGDYTGRLSSGLHNSVIFVVQMLQNLGITAEMVEVIDNNAIDREVTRFRPTHCIIEAFWVVPEKFDVLITLHPLVRWIVRNHSEMPFLSNEGIALEWTAGYLQRNIEVMCNSLRALADLQAVAIAYGYSDRMVTYGPNTYPIYTTAVNQVYQSDDKTLNIGCFGAIRPLKNQLMQAIAAIDFCRSRHYRLVFHINSTRVEGFAEPILKNLRKLFDQAINCTLVEHDWVPHNQFLTILAEMDLLMQVSFSETFNIVAADATAVGVPVIVSSEISWIGDYAWANPTSVPSMLKKLESTWETNRSSRIMHQRRDLMHYCHRSEIVWGDRFADRS